MKKLLAVSLSVLLFDFVYSQNVIITQGFHPGEIGESKDVIASAGETSDIGSHTVSWTLGEVFTGTESGVNSVEPLKHIADLKVYPNPTTDKVMVEIFTKNNAAADLVISLFDLEGKKLYSQKIQETNYKGEVDLTLLAGGQYVLNIATKDGFFVENFSVQKIH